MATMSNESDPSGTFMGVSRTTIPWWPTVDADLCDGCDGGYDCLKFCPHGVYKKLTNPAIIEVENKFNCVVFCQACKKMCPKDAITFPKKAEILQIIKEARKSF